MKGTWKRVLTVLFAAASIGLGGCRAADAPGSTEPLPSETQLELTPTQLPSGLFIRPAHPAEEPGEGEGTPVEAEVLRYRDQLSTFRSWLRQWGDPSGLGLVRISSKQELDDFLDQVSFKDLTRAADFDETFFEDHVLLVLLHETGSGSVRYTVSLAEEGDVLTVVVHADTPEYATDDIAQWFLLVPVEKSAIEGKELALRLTGGIDYGENAVTGSTIPLEAQ